MKCPICEKQLNVGSIPFLWMDRYGDKCVARTECCGHAVTMRKVSTYTADPYVGERSEDDWGTEFTPLKSKIQAQVNDELYDSVLMHLKNNELREALDVIRSIKNPLTAAWVTHQVLEYLDTPSQKQTRNWLINALYSGV
ncbi:hypothetical protein [Escherichia phage vB_EcoM_JNE01]|nr:hypothetical protein [Escherichia phage vB_EcoM_JNE01]